jgi:hypothetical protein
MDLASSLKAQGKLPEALALMEPLVADLRKGWDKRPSPDDARRLRRGLTDLADLYRDLKRPEDERRLRAELERLKPTPAK